MILDKIVTSAPSDRRSGENQKARPKTYLATITSVVMAALLVTGCTEGTENQQSGSAGFVGPGSQQVDANNAMSLFKTVCIETLPQFAKAPSRIAAYPFRQSPQTGTYFHTDLDLSFKLGKMRGSGKKFCSMVFTSKEKADKLSLLMSLSAATGSSTKNPSIGIDPQNGASSIVLTNGAQFSFIPTGRQGGQTYYRALLVAAK